MSFANMRNNTFLSAEKDEHAPVWVQDADDQSSDNNKYVKPTHARNRSASTAETWNTTSFSSNL